MGRALRCLRGMQGRSVAAAVSPVPPFGSGGGATRLAGQRGSWAAAAAPAPDTGCQAQCQTRRADPRSARAPPARAQADSGGAAPPGHECRLSTATIWKALHRAGAPTLRPRRRHPAPKRYSRPIPGERIQMDTFKVSAGVYQYAARRLLPRPGARALSPASCEVFD